MKRADELLVMFFLFTAKCLYLLGCEYPPCDAKDMSPPADMRPSPDGDICIDCGDRVACPPPRGCVTKGNLCCCGDKAEGDITAKKAICGEG